MNWLMTLRVALRALARNKMRSFLTGLGVVIGVAAVIAMVAIGDGAKARVEQTFASMGSNMLIVLNGSSRRRRRHGRLRLAADAHLGRPEGHPDRALARSATPRRCCAPARRSCPRTPTGTPRCRGPRPTFLRVRILARGAWAPASRQSDVDGGTKVALLGQTVVDKLYGSNANPVGQVVRIKNIPFTVVGVLARKGQSPFGQDYDDVVLVPVTTFQQKISGGLKNYIAGHDRGERRLGRGRQRRGPSSRSAACCATATGSPSTPTTTSASATSPRSPARSRRGPRPSPRCSRPSPRSRCWWAASAS